MYNKIISPESGKAFHVNSGIGKNILKNYIKIFLNKTQSGGGLLDYIFGTADNTTYEDTAQTINKGNIDLISTKKKEIGRSNDGMGELITYETTKTYLLKKMGVGEFKVIHITKTTSWDFHDDNTVPDKVVEAMKQSVLNNKRTTIINERKNSVHRW